MVDAFRPQLRRSHRVKTVHASVSIEGNPLTEHQVTAILDGKRVIAPKRDLREVTNAIACYEQFPHWNPSSTDDLLAAHNEMMSGLVERSGLWRQRGVGIAKGDQIAHVAPPANRVPALIGELLTWFEKDTEIPPPIGAAVVHYELEFIHPFEDGNGRMGRLWHSLILHHYHELLGQIPIESAIRDRQEDYYATLAYCDATGNSTRFVEFSLEVTLASLSENSPSGNRMSGGERMQVARKILGGIEFTRKDYLQQFPGLSPATASRDLRQAVADKILIREGDKATTRYRFAEMEHG